MVIVSVFLTEEIQNHQDPCTSVPEVPPTGQVGVNVNVLHAAVRTVSDWSATIYPALVCSTSDWSTDSLPTPGSLSTSSNLKPDLCCICDVL